MDFAFHTIPYDSLTFLENVLPTIPKASAVYKIFDTRGKLIVLDKTSNLFQRLERFYGARSELPHDLDLRQITSHIEFVRTASPFETLYVLYRERRQQFPKTYRKMRTFRFFTLMKINRKQRFPRIYASRQIKPGVDYFGPFVSRSQFTRMKTALERTFKLRPCPFNIRGGDPHPDCIYFQMHTCSRPCNDDIDRGSYLADVRSAIGFLQGQEDGGLMLRQIEDLSAQMRFEEAEAVRKRMEKVAKARHEEKETFMSVWEFNYLVLLPAVSTSFCRVAFVREGSILGFEEYETGALSEQLEANIRRFYSGPPIPVNRDWQYDEFCIICNFIIDPLQTVDLIPVTATAELPALVMRRLEERKKKRKPNDR